MTASHTHALSSRAPGAAPWLVPLVGAALAVLLGLTIGHPSPATLGPLLVLLTAAVVLSAATHPFPAFLVLVGSTIVLIAINTPLGFSVNAFDVLIPPLLVAAVIGPLRTRAIAEDTALAGDAHAHVSRAHRRFVRSAVVFYAIAASSIVLMVFKAPMGSVIHSLQALLREYEVLLLFPIAIWCLRDRRDLRATLLTLLAGLALFVVINSIGIAAFGVERAGTTWFVNNPAWPIADPNEGGFAMVVTMAVLLIFHAMRPRWFHLALVVVSVVMIVMTQSRSGLLASLVFTILVLPRFRRLWKPAVIVLFGLLLLTPLVPANYWTRIGNTVTLERGTFEAYTSFIRFLHWQAALGVFLSHPILGNGFLALGTASAQHNPLHVVMGTAESYYLEIASGMGIVGLIALGFVLVRLYQLGSAVRRVTTPGTLGHEMARLHGPFIAALLVANVTADNLIGISSIAQIAVWSATLIRAGHLGIGETSGAVPADRSGA